MGCVISGASSARGKALHHRGSRGEHGVRRAGSEGSGGGD